MKKSQSVFLLTAAMAVAAVSCSRDLPPQSDPAPALATAASPLSAASSTLVLAWGEEPNQVGLEPAASERAAWGPQSVALAPNGTVAVLDNHRSRLALFDEATLVGNVPVDPMVSDFCFLSDNEIALLNLSMLHVEKVDADGKRLIIYPISPAFKTAVALDCRNGSPVIVTMHQESYVVDSVNPLATRREGIPGEDGSYRQLTFAAGLPGRLLLFEAVEPLLRGAGEKPQVTSGFDSECTAVRLLGSLASGEAAFLCDIASGEEGDASVARYIELYASGARAARFAVETGLYQPFRGFRISGSNVVTAVPVEEGLKVGIYRFSREVTR